MSITIKNWKLAVLALVLFILFCSLGTWQLNRAEEKKILLKSFAERAKHAPLDANALQHPADLRFYRAKLRGHFINQHTFLLDNKTLHGQIGYEIYTLFEAEGLAAPILVDRGFIQMTGGRDVLPTIRPIEGTITLIGMLNLPPTFVTLGKITDSIQTTWPLRVEYIQLAELSKLSHSAKGYFSYLLSLDLNPQIVMMTPEKHTGYAVQWFAFALTLLILFVVLNKK